jgi:hypothetical protein
LSLVPSLPLVDRPVRVGARGAVVCGFTPGSAGSTDRALGLHGSAIGRDRDRNERNLNVDER